MEVTERDRAESGRREEGRGSEGRKEAGGGKRDIEIYLLVHSTSTCIGWGWARLSQEPKYCGPSSAASQLNQEEAEAGNRPEAEAGCESRPSDRKCGIQVAT